MREILFRGKAINRDKRFHTTNYKNGDWVYGLITRLYDERFEKLPAEMTNTNDIKSIEVDYKTISQYTGLTDKNGKKIFEGDIVELFDMRGKIVQECGAFGIATTQQIDYDLLDSKIPFQNNAYFCFNDNFISIWELWWNYHQDDEPLEVAEVIGNIYDTPELLKGDCCK